ncbi:gene transfer agent family protein [Porphyrobacter sp. GA68]|uniref:gene transfer agent family protein n=1 Tax=Porphyrobacter sp. GA68 TaxID=2883480 RepID=UPI001D1966F2|nr:gene transfer agent family protein [Porphyrobacter sp. GA68]
MSVANPLRGEAELVIGGRRHVLRPTFEALVRAEEELGSLFALAERAGAGDLRLAEIAALFAHCLTGTPEPDRQSVGEAVLRMGVAQAVKPLRILLSQIFAGDG